MTEKELKKYTIEFINNETGSNRSNINSVMGKMLIKYAEVFQNRIKEFELKIKYLTRHVEPQNMTALFEQVEEEVKQEQRVKELEEQIEKMINEIDKTMVLSNMRECEICDIQDIFRKYGFKRNSNDTWEINKNALS